MQVEVLGFEADIRGRWAAEAMRWMLQSSSRHLTTRSHQVSATAHFAQLPTQNLIICKVIFHNLHRNFHADSTGLQSSAEREGSRSLLNIAGMLA